jgi:hypothetical protein
MLPDIYSLTLVATFGGVKRLIIGMCCFGAGGLKPRFIASKKEHPTNSTGVQM